MKNIYRLRKFYQRKNVTMVMKKVMLQSTEKCIETSHRSMLSIPGTLFTSTWFHSPLTFLTSTFTYLIYILLITHYNYTNLSLFSFTFFLSISYYFSLFSLNYIRLCHYIMVFRRLHLVLLSTSELLYPIFHLGIL